MAEGSGQPTATPPVYYRVRDTYGVPWVAKAIYDSYENKIREDLVFLCDDQAVVYAHKAVFAAASPFLESLTRALPDVGITYISLPGVHFKTMLNVVHYVYGHGKVISRNEIVRLHSVLKMLNIPTILEPRGSQAPDENRELFFLFREVNTNTSPESSNSNLNSRRTNESEATSAADEMNLRRGSDEMKSRTGSAAPVRQESRTRSPSPQPNWRANNFKIPVGILRRKTQRTYRCVSHLLNIYEEVTPEDRTAREERSGSDEETAQDEDRAENENTTEEKESSEDESVVKEEEKDQDDDVAIDEERPQDEKMVKEKEKDQDEVVVLEEERAQDEVMVIEEERAEDEEMVEEKDRTQDERLAEVATVTAKPEPVEVKKFSKKRSKKRRKKIGMRNKKKKMLCKATGGAEPNVKEEKPVQEENPVCVPVKEEFVPTAGPSKESPPRPKRISSSPFKGSGDVLVHDVNMDVPAEETVSEKGLTTNTEAVREETKPLPTLEVSGTCLKKEELSEDFKDLLVPSVSDIIASMAGNFMKIGNKPKTKGRRRKSCTNINENHVASKVKPRNKRRHTVEAAGSSSTIYSPVKSEGEQLTEPVSGPSQITEILNESKIVPTSDYATTEVKEETEKEVKQDEEKMEVSFSVPQIRMSFLPRLRSQRTPSAPPAAPVPLKEISFPKQEKQGNMIKEFVKLEKKDDDDESGTPAKNEVVETQKSRARFTEEQRAILESHFIHNRYPDRQTKQKLAEDFKVSLKSITYWFENRMKRITDVPRKRRRTFTEEEKQVLEAAYTTKKRDRSKLYTKLAEDLNVSRNSIMTWFHNRRVRDNITEEKADSRNTTSRKEEKPQKCLSFQQFTERQKQRLMMAYSENAYQNAPLCQKLAKELCMSAMSVRNWFRHIRSKALQGENNVRHTQVKTAPAKSKMLSAANVEELEKVYSTVSHPARLRQRQLAETMQVSEDCVEEWFAKKRAETKPASPMKNCFNWEVGHKQKKKTKFTPEQRAALEAAYAEEENPGKDQLIKLSEELKVTQESLVSWFRSRRTKVITSIFPQSSGKSGRLHARHKRRHKMATDLLSLCECNDAKKGPSKGDQEEEEVLTQRSDTSSAITESPEKDGSVVIHPSPPPCPDTPGDAYFDSLIEELKALDHGGVLSPKQIHVENVSESGAAVDSDKQCDADRVRQENSAPTALVNCLDEKITEREVPGSSAAQSQDGMTREELEHETGSGPLHTMSMEKHDITTAEDVEDPEKKHLTEAGPLKTMGLGPQIKARAVSYFGANKTTTKETRERISSEMGMKQFAERPNKDNAGVVEVPEKKDLKDFPEAGSGPEIKARLESNFGGNKSTAKESREMISSKMGMEVSAVEKQFAERPKKDNAGLCPVKAVSKKKGLKAFGTGMGLTEQQIKKLEVYYTKNPNPNRAEFSAIADELRTRVSTVMYWYKNKKAKDKSESSSKRKLFEADSNQTKPAGLGRNKTTCEICKVAVTKSRLKKHMSSHAGGQYCCLHCGARFGNLFNLRRHIKNHLTKD